MLIDNNNNPFPRKTDIEALLEDGSYTKIREIFSEHGVFLLGKKQQMSEKMIRYAFGESFYKRAFSTLSRNAFGLSITGIRSTIPSEFDLLKSLKDQENKRYQDHKYDPHITHVIEQKDNILLKVQYTKINPRYTEFGRRDIFQIDIFVHRFSDDQIEFFSYPKTPSDQLIARDIVNSTLKTMNFPPISFDIEELPVKSRVDLFDQILQGSSSSQWKVEEASGLTVRAGSSDSSEGEALDDDKVRMLQSAILEGSNLRDHQIVKDLLNDDFYFSAANLWVYKSGVGGSLDQYKVRIEFKKKPQILVVNVSDARSPILDKDSWEYKNVPDDKGLEVIRFFWDFAHSKYLELRNSILTNTARKVTRNKS